MADDSILELEKKLSIEYFTLKNFQFSSGDNLKDLIVEYTTIGTPIKNEKGEIINAIVFNHGIGENCLRVGAFYEIMGDKRALDTEKYFIISITALGSIGSHSPSNSGLKWNFPKYVINDMVNFQKEFLHEKFNIKHVKGLIGYSMGGFEVLTWAINYPDYMDFVIPLLSSYKFTGRNYAVSKIVNNCIENDPQYNGGNYKEPLKSIGLANQVAYLFGLSLEYYGSLGIDEINQTLNSLMGNFKNYDANDIILRNNVIGSYNAEDKLDNIIAKTLIIAINQDLYFPPHIDAIPMSKMIKDSNLIIYDSSFGHLGIDEIFKIENELKEFLNQF
ncbi:MAG: alpha/beta fold hydrolase [Methanobrevibacter sp.]|jgi:homoserine O-acetyltransferase|nr:alpha/beta fold hydrolase [Methanobrevibacter sp.]